MKNVQGRTYGLYTAIFGACGLGAFYLAGIRSEPLNIAFALVIAFGLLLYFGGMVMALFAMKPDKNIHKDDTAVAASAIIRCMVAISVADEHLDDQEVRVIGKIYEKLTGSQISESMIREIAALMLESGIDLAAELLHVNKTFDKNLKHKIIRASLYILAADGTIEAAEEEMLDVVREGLGVAKGAFNTIKTEFLQEISLRKTGAKTA